MTPTVTNVISSKLYAETAKNNIPAKVAVADNKQTEVFDYVNSLGENNIDYFTSEKETEVCDKKEKTKNILKTIGLTALGIGVIVGGAFFVRKFLTKSARIARKEAKKYYQELRDAEKYIKEHCKVYREGNYTTIIESKDGEVIDLSKLGRFYGGKIIRYDTPEQAKQAAKDLIMKQFELPLEIQKECAVTVEGRDIIGIAIGNATSVETRGLSSILQKRTLDIYHNHPLHHSVDFPLSMGDIKSLLSYNEKSVTAFNHLGEYSCAEIIKPIEVKYYYSHEIFDAIDQYEAMAYLGKEKGMRFHSLSKILKDNPEKVKEIKEEYNILRKEFDNLQYDLLNKTPQKYVQLKHEMLSEILPKYGIKYTTNYSNLINV